MDAVHKRLMSGDPEKRLTYKYQYWLAMWRKFGGESNNKYARYMRQQTKEIRATFKKHSNKDR